MRLFQAIVLHVVNYYKLKMQPVFAPFYNSDSCPYFHVPKIVSNELIFTVLTENKLPVFFASYLSFYGFLFKNQLKIVTLMNYRTCPQKRKISTMILLHYFCITQETHFAFINLPESLNALVFYFSILIFFYIVFPFVIKLFLF